LNGGPFLERGCHFRIFRTSSILWNIGKTSITMILTKEIILVKTDDKFKFKVDINDNLLDK